MEVKVTGRKITVTDAMHEYAVEKISNSMKVLAIDSLVADVVLRVEKSHVVPCICEVTMRLKGHIIHVEEHEADMYAAIDVASAKFLRQLRKYKTRVLERRKADADASPALVPTGASLDELMAELAADDEVVRVKEIDFEPLTEEEALIQMDLLGHDFFAYTDRDTDSFRVLYRRDGGGYGLLQQKEL